MPVLQDKLEQALESRRKRQILRRLPDPTPSSDSASPPLIDFSTNDYLSLSTYPPLRARFLEKVNSFDHVLGSGGSRLLVNPSHHQELEDRLRRFFFDDVELTKDSGEALLFNSGFDANAGLFACLPQAGDVVLMDEYIHASVHDGVRASRASKSCFLFPHNDMSAFRNLLSNIVHDSAGISRGTSSVIVAVEALYSMDGTFAPLDQIVAMVDELLPLGNGHIIVDEAHATGLFGPMGRGLVAHFRLESKVLARLVTFGKALAGNGGAHTVDLLVDRD
jgi:8-amino-7-oxononanoate synthase